MWLGIPNFHFNNLIRNFSMSKFMHFAKSLLGMWNFLAKIPPHPRCYRSVWMFSWLLFVNVFMITIFSFNLIEKSTCKFFNSIQFTHLLRQWCITETFTRELSKFAAWHAVDGATRPNMINMESSIIYIWFYQFFN